MHRTSVLFHYETKRSPNKPKVNRNTEQKELIITLYSVT